MRRRILDAAEVVFSKRGRPGATIDEIAVAARLPKRRGHIDVDELYREPDRSAYGDVNGAGIGAFVVGLVAGWSVEDGLVPALQGPVSTKLLGGADLSWLVGIVVAGGVYLALSRSSVPAAVPEPARRVRG